MSRPDHNALRERIADLRAPGGGSAAFWWLVRQATRLEYDWLLRRRLEPAGAPPPDPAPFRAGVLADATDLARVPPGLVAQLERRTARGVADLLAAGERVYYLADGDQVACQLCVAGAPRARVEAPIPGWLELPPGAAYQSFTFTPERYRRRGAARSLYAHMHRDLAGLGYGEVFCLVSRTNVAQLGNVRRLGYRPVAGVWATRGGRLLHAPGLPRLGLRHVAGEPGR